ncbi:hypothetical protein QFC19_001531 [Naganishia cerealis]|uniref:Uncharacterized protein n=1 Tax=Naganishia cerealis TaxID=610337 RepID=A0ACC2WJH1_9TREE|nr:hypothetical protein QFC19_001531 [Naganishia cerealis]
MPNSPTVVQSPDDENQLTDSVNNDTRSRVDQVGNPESDRVIIFETGDILECTDCNETAHHAYDERTYADKLKQRATFVSCEYDRASYTSAYPKAHRSPIFGPLKANETINEKTPIECSD